MNAGASKLEEEIETWKGFPWALRKDDLELWNRMIGEIRAGFAEAVEASGKTFATDPFFMALLLVQQKTIRRLESELRANGVRVPEAKTVALTLDAWQER